MSADGMAGRRTGSVFLAPVEQLGDRSVWAIGALDSDALDATLIWSRPERAWILRAGLPLNGVRTARWEAGPALDDRPRSVPDDIWMEVLAALLAWAAREAFGHRRRLFRIGDQAEHARDRLRRIIRRIPVWPPEEGSA